MKTGQKFRKKKKENPDITAGRFVGELLT